MLHDMQPLDGDRRNVSQGLYLRANFKQSQLIATPTDPDEKNAEERPRKEITDEGGICKYLRGILRLSER